MASRSLYDLQISVRDSAQMMLSASQSSGFDFLIYCTKRTHREQAILYRNGRSLAEIQDKAKELETQWHRPDLASLLLMTPPQYGKSKLTNAGPGQSSHEYGFAFDGCPLLHGKPIWDDSDPLWQTYGELGMTSGLEWAGTWRSFKEFPHLQDPHVNWRDLIKEAA